MDVDGDALHNVERVCNCEVMTRLESLSEPTEGPSRRDKDVSIPHAAHGYIDPETGKQLGSFMTYVIKFNVPRGSDGCIN